MQRRWFIVLCMFLSIALMLVFAEVASAGAAPAGKPIRIGEINSYSGLATVFTFPYKEGIAMALNEINAAGGILGRRLEFVFRDDKLRPDEAVKMARELVFQEKVDFLAGCISSAVGLAISAWARENKSLYFATSCQTSRLTEEEGHRYIAHTTGNVNMFARSMAKQAANLPYKKWAIIGPDYEYGHNVWDEFWAHLKQLKPDVEVVQEQWPKLGEADHSAFITALLQSGAEAVASSLWGGQSITFIKQARPFGLFEKVKYFGAVIGSADELDPLGKEAPVGAIGAQPFPWYDEGVQKAHPRLAEWVKKSKDFMGQEPKVGSQGGYVTVYVIAEAIKRAGSTDVEKVIGALDKGFELEMPWGKVILRGCDHQALPPYWIGTVAFSPEERPIVKDIQEMHGKDLIRSCEEVLQKRKK
ncbi:MAG: ABC transporter substrate-binding protein [Candidatus Tectomicrobia bacterium]|nr:ABC transporter substrate-binding protein [Candidatus Tectomicrobia bacterium]